MRETFKFNMLIFLKRILVYGKEKNTKELAKIYSFRKIPDPPGSFRH